MTNHEKKTQRKRQRQSTAPTTAGWILRCCWLRALIIVAAAAAAAIDTMSIPSFCLGPGAAVDQDCFALIPTNRTEFNQQDDNSDEFGQVCLQWHDTSNGTPLLTVTYTTLNGWTLKDAHFWVGSSMAEAPLTQDNLPSIRDFPFWNQDQHGHDSSSTGPVTEWSHILVDDTAMDVCQDPHEVVQDEQQEEEQDGLTTSDLTSSNKEEISLERFLMAQAVLQRQTDHGQVVDITVFASNQPTTTNFDQLEDYVIKCECPRVEVKHVDLETLTMEEQAIAQEALVENQKKQESQQLVKEQPTAPPSPVPNNNNEVVDDLYDAQLVQVETSFTVVLPASQANVHVTSAGGQPQASSALEQSERDIQSNSALHEAWELFVEDVMMQAQVPTLMDANHPGLRRRRYLTMLRNVELLGGSAALFDFVVPTDCPKNVLEDAQDAVPSSMKHHHSHAQAIKELMLQAKLSGEPPVCFKVFGKFTLLHVLTDSSYNTTGSNTPRVMCDTILQATQDLLDQHILEQTLLKVAPQTPFCIEHGYASACEATGETTRVPLPELLPTLAPTVSQTTDEINTLFAMHQSDGSLEINHAVGLAAYFLLCVLIMGSLIGLYCMLLPKVHTSERNRATDDWGQQKLGQYDLDVLDDPGKWLDENLNDEDGAEYGAGYNVVRTRTQVLPPPRPIYPPNPACVYG